MSQRNCGFPIFNCTLLLLTDLHVGIISALEFCSHTLYNVTNRWKICIYSTKKHKANGSLMVVQWGVTPSTALHPEPECVLDTNHTHTHRLPLFSLDRLVFSVTHVAWELGGTTCMQLYCLPLGHISPCVRMCLCVYWERQMWHYNSFSITDNRNVRQGALWVNGAGSL